MPYIAITAEALAAIESQREFAPQKHPAHPKRRSPEGFEIWLEDETLEALKEVALGNETISDTIIRRVALYATGGRLA
jgi:hypothetical protein